MKCPEFVQYETAILMFHLFHGTLPIHLQNRFTLYSTTRSRPTRRINTFVMVQARTNMCLSVYGVKLWNSWGGEGGMLGREGGREGGEGVA